MAQKTVRLKKAKTAKRINLKPIHTLLTRKVQELKQGKHTRPMTQAHKDHNAQIDRTIAMLSSVRMCGRGGLCGPDMAIPSA